MTPVCGEIPPGRGASTCCITGACTPPGCICGITCCCRTTDCWGWKIYWAPLAALTTWRSWPEFVNICWTGVTPAGSAKVAAVAAALMFDAFICCINLESGTITCGAVACCDAGIRTCWVCACWGTVCWGWACWWWWWWWCCCCWGWCCCWTCSRSCCSSEWNPSTALDCISLFSHKVFSSISTCSSTPSSRKMSLTSLMTSSITDLYNLGTVFVFAEFAISTHNTNKRGQPQENKIKTKPKKKKKKLKHPEGDPNHRKIGEKILNKINPEGVRESGERRRGHSSRS